MPSILLKRAAAPLRQMGGEYLSTLVILSAAKDLKVA
jgi:hypothetical protein